MPWRAQVYAGQVIEVKTDGDQVQGYVLGEVRQFFLTPNCMLKIEEAKSDEIP